MGLHNLVSNYRKIGMGATLAASLALGGCPMFGGNSGPVIYTPADGNTVRQKGCENAHVIGRPYAFLDDTFRFDVGTGKRKTTTIYVRTEPSETYKRFASDMGQLNVASVSVMGHCEKQDGFEGYLQADTAEALAEDGRITRYEF